MTKTMPQTTGESRDETERSVYAKTMIAPEFAEAVDILISPSVTALANALGISSVVVGIALAARRALSRKSRSTEAEIIELGDSVIFRYGGKEVRLTKEDAIALMELCEEEAATSHIRR